MSALRAVLILCSLVSLDVLGGTVPLYTWFSPSREDYFTTSNPAWAGQPGDRKSPDYVFVRLEGRVFAPSDPQPDATIPLFSWWNAERGDNFTTTDGRWNGAAGVVRDGYAFVRLEGFVFAREVAGTLPLRGYWNRGAADNYLSADPRFLPFRTPPWYSGGGVLGHILQVERDDLLAAFGHGTMRVNGRAASGERPLLVILVEFSDRPLTSSARASVTARFFGPSFPNVRGYFDAVSDGRFRWSNAGVIGPVRPRDDPGTAEDESRSDVASRDEGRRTAARVVASLLRSGALQAWRFDTNRDGTVTTDELGIAMVWAGGGAHVREMIPRSVSDAGQSVAANVAVFGVGVDFATMTHEICHLLGAWDLYGSAHHSVGLTLMSSTGAFSTQTLFLDPWHRMRLGWVEPRVMEVRDSGATARVSASGSYAAAAYDRRPLLLFDPLRGTREFFLVEYRHGGLPDSYDRNVSDRQGRARGLAAWLVKTDAEGEASLIPGIAIHPGADLRFDSVVRGDDEPVRNSAGVVEAITAGQNRIPESVLSGDDLYFQDRAVLAVGATEPTRGYSHLHLEHDGPMPLKWLPERGQFERVLTMLSVTPTVASTQVVTVQWGHRPIPRLDSVPRVVRAGTTLTLAGAFPAARSPAVSVRISDDDLGTYALPIVSWSASGATVQVPRDAAPGRYMLEVWTDARGAVRSNWAELQVTAPL